MKKLIIILSLSLTFAAQLEVEGDLKLEGNLVFPDESSMVTAAEKLPAGIIFPYAGQNAPAGYLLCSGQEVSRADYDNLFNVIGELYGEGDGESTFNIPNLADRFPLGKGSNHPELAEIGGSETHILTIDELPSHNHSVPGMGGFPTGSSGYSPGGNGGHPNYQATGSGDSNPAGNDQPHNNMPPYLTLNYIIKY